MDVSKYSLLIITYLISCFEKKEKKEQKEQKEKAM